MEKKSTHIVAYVLAAIMIGTGALYFAVASDEYRDHQQELQTNAETEENEAEENEHAESTEAFESEGFGDMGEVVFFSVIGATYVPVGLWMLKKRDMSKKPYLIALAGSAALIAFYIATRTVNIPMIGIQDDVGAPDLTVKALQGTIVAMAGFMLFAISKHKKAQKLA